MNISKFIFTNSLHLINQVFLIIVGFYLFVSCEEKDKKPIPDPTASNAINSTKTKVVCDTLLQTYGEIKVDNQIWMNRNLDVDTFRNGDKILHAQSDEEWESAGNNGIPAWCYYLNIECLGGRDGKLYNFHAVEDERGLAPDGWHIPSDEEWKRLTDLYGKEVAYVLKSKDGWYNGGQGRNSNGFNGFPGGMRYYDGEFLYHGTHGFWWTESGVVLTHAWFRYLTYDYSDRIFRQKARRGAGMSVRCVKDY